MQHYETTDLDFSIVLLYFGIKLLRTEKKFGKVTFIFQESPQIEELKTKFINDDLQVSPRKFLSLMRQTKGTFILNQ